MITNGFPVVLLRIIESEQYPNAIGWGPGGNVWVKPVDFERDCMKTHFPGINKYASFARKMNRYGFKRVVEKGGCPNEPFLYYHEKFRKGLGPEEANMIRISKTRHSAIAQKSEVDLAKKTKGEIHEITAILNAPSNQMTSMAEHCSMIGHLKGKSSSPNPSAYVLPFHHPLFVPRGLEQCPNPHTKLCTSYAAPMHQDSNTMHIACGRSTLIALLLGQPGASNYSSQEILRVANRVHVLGAKDYSPTPVPQDAGATVPALRPSMVNSGQVNLMQLSDLKTILAFLAMRQRL